MRLIPRMFMCLLSFAVIWGGGVGCANKIDASLLDSRLRDAQNVISDTRLLGAEEYAGKKLTNAEELLEESKQARIAGNGVQSLELLYLAKTEAQSAGALTRQKIAQSRIITARADLLKTMSLQMEYKVQTALTNQKIAEERERRALSRAEKR